eukprot:3704093-Rhodomonas_salina.3
MCIRDRSYARLCTARLAAAFCTARVLSGARETLLSVRIGLCWALGARAWSNAGQNTRVFT